MTDFEAGKNFDLKNLSITPSGEKPVEEVKSLHRADPENIRQRSVSVRGSFYDKGRVDFMRQAATNLAGQQEIVIDVDEAELWDGTPNDDSERQIGVRIVNKTKPNNLDDFWNEVERLEKEAKAKSASLQGNQG